MKIKKEREQKPSGFGLNLDEEGRSELEGDSKFPRFITKKIREIDLKNGQFRNYVLSLGYKNFVTR